MKNPMVVIAWLGAFLVAVLSWVIAFPLHGQQDVQMVCIFVLVALVAFLLYDGDVSQDDV